MGAGPLRVFLERGGSEPEARRLHGKGLRSRGSYSAAAQMRNENGRPDRQHRTGQPRHAAQGPVSVMGTGLRRYVFLALAFVSAAACVTPRKAFSPTECNEAAAYDRGYS